MSTTWRAWVPAPPQEVRARLLEFVTMGALMGDVDDTTFRLTHRLTGRNSWRPYLTGQLEAAAGGTLVEVRLGVHPFVFVFTLLHAIPFLGLSWLMGVAAFTGSAHNAIAVLREATEATVEGDEVNDLLDDVGAPEDDGAEARAPWSLRASATLDGVRFTLRGPRRWVGTQTTVLDVDPAGLRVGDTELPWHRVRHIGVATAERVVEIDHDEGTMRIDAADHGEAHLDWLARYLEHRRARWSSDPEAAARLHEAGRRLLRQSAARSAQVDPKA